MANVQTSGIAEVKKVCTEYDIACQFEGNALPVTASHLDIMGVNFNNLSAWYNDEMLELASFVRCCIEDEGMTYKQLKKELVNYNQEGWLELFGAYSKESYQESLYRLKDLLQMSLKECSYAIEKWGDVKNKAITHEFKSTESAFIYKGYYITPCIIKHAINSVLRKIKANDMCKYYALYYAGNKVKNDTIINDCLSDLFNNDNNERLTMLDELSGHALINLNDVRNSRN